MPKYICFFSYTREAGKAMIEKPTDRVAAAKALVESVGGKMECFYWMHGHHDGFFIADYQGRHVRGRSGGCGREHGRYNPGRNPRAVRRCRPGPDPESGQDRPRRVQAAHGLIAGRTGSSSAAPPLRGAPSLPFRRPPVERVPAPRSPVTYSTRRTAAASSKPTTTPNGRTPQ